MLDYFIVTKQVWCVGATGGWSGGEYYHHLVTHRSAAHQVETKDPSSSVCRGVGTDQLREYRHSDLGHQPRHLQGCAQACNGQAQVLLLLELVTYDSSPHHSYGWGLHIN